MLKENVQKDWIECQSQKLKTMGKQKKVWYRVWGKKREKRQRGKTYICYWGLQRPPPRPQNQIANQPK